MFFDHFHALQPAKPLVRQRQSKFTSEFTEKIPLFQFFNESSQSNQNKMSSQIDTKPKSENSHNGAPDLEVNSSEYGTPYKFY